MTDVSKLPKWAQFRIQALESQLAAAEAVLAQGPADSRAFEDSYGTVPRPLGHDPRVQFLVARNPKHSQFLADDEFYIRAHHTQEGDLRLLGSHTFFLRPEASNLLVVELGR